MSSTGINSCLVNILQSERRDKKKAFKKVFVYRDEHWVNPTTVTLTNAANVFTGPVALLCSKYRSFQNFVSGLAVIQTTKPNMSGRERDKEFEAIAVMDLDSFLSAFSEAEALADALVQKSEDLVQEWGADNAHKVMLFIIINRFSSFTNPYRRKKLEFAFQSNELLLSATTRGREGGAKNIRTWTCN